MDLEDRIAGGLLGGAIGDAWGRPYEGRPGPRSFRRPVVARVSDDTQLTLATAESIIELGHVDAEHVASTLLRWFRHGRLSGLGASTLKALRDLDAGAHWALAGRRGEHAAGSGAAMRAAPLGFLLDHREQTDRVVLRDVCRITHHSEEAYVGALAMVVAIQVAVGDTGRGLGSLLREVAAELPDSSVRDRCLHLSASKEDPSEVAQRSGSGGYVVESVPLALYCAQHGTDLPLTDVVEGAIRCGGDTDTIASMAGQVVGAARGASSMPDVDGLGIEGIEGLAAIARRLAAIVPRPG